MRKAVFIVATVVVGVMGAGSVVQAHLAGAFKEFLVGVGNENSDEALYEQLEATGEEIERLTPRYEALTTEYGDNQDLAIEKMIFYSTMGLDTFAEFFKESNSVVDFLGNKKIVEDNVESYLRELNELYMDYQKVKISKESLESYQSLLDMISGNADGKKEIYEKFSTVEDEKDREEMIARYISTLWAGYEGILEKEISSDEEMFNLNIHQFITRKTDVSPYHFEQDRINDKSDLDYFIMKDHVYLHYENYGDEIILIGLSKNNEGKELQIEFEAGFINGFMIPESEMNYLGPITIKFDNIAANSDFIIEQSRGSIVLLDTRNSGE